MSKKVSLTGIKPTSSPHLGNYVGAIRPAIELAKTDQYLGYYFIADYHALTTVHKPLDLKSYIYEVAATWLACGLDPEKVVLYQQSHIPEILELNWIISCFTAKGLMNRAHAYKAISQENLDNKRDPDQSINIGLYTYPVLMSADILFLSADIVPVGADQVQHIEICRDVAHAFNYVYGDVLKIPKEFTQSNTVIQGLDGRKMSKSYNNHIPLFVPEKKLRKMVNKIVTDSTPPEEPKNPKESVIFEIYKSFGSKEQIKELENRYQTGIGWGEAKAELFEVINNELSAPRESYLELIQDTVKIDAVLKQGAEKVRPLAQNFLSEVKKIIGVS
jgi:tryptophanyl-tRNA synthetase